MTNKKIQSTEFEPFEGKKRESSDHFSGDKTVDVRDKYDWNPKMRGTHFVRGRKVAGDIGMVRLDRSGTKEDLLCKLFSRGLLTGQALKDAEVHCCHEKNELGPLTSLPSSGFSADKSKPV